MNKAGHGAPIALLLAIVVMAGGCSVLSPQPDRSRFFVLVPSTDSHNVAPAAVVGDDPNFTLGLGPITIPRYLQRPEVVTRISETELSVSDNDRWAEPLNTCVASVLAQDLSMDLQGVQIAPFPWSEKSRISYSVSVEFLHLETTADRKAKVEAIWTIRGPDNRLLQSGTTTANRAAGGDRISDTAALSEGIEQVSQEIGKALQQRHRETRNSKQTHS